MQTAPNGCQRTPASAIQPPARASRFRALSIHAMLLAAFFCLLPQALHAQFNAALRGTVSDSTGAIIPGATVTLVNKATGALLTAQSNSSGIYTFNALPPDQFSLKVEMQGFKTKSVAQVVLIPEQANVLNLQLEVGSNQETVTVNGTEAPLLDTDTATSSATIDSNAVQHLPSYNRDVFQLAQLAPGAFGDGSQSGGGGTNNNPGNQGPGGSSAGSAGIFTTENGPQIQAKGGQYETNSVTVDGVSTVSAVWGGTSVITPSEDSISDVKIVSNTYDAESGRFSGAQIQVTSKSGTNQLHGSYFLKVSRPGLNAYQRWNGLGSDVPGTAAERGLNRDTSRFNNYGGSLGGPILKNRIFAFFNYETSPLDSVSVSQGWYETPEFDKLAMPANSISGTYLAFPGEGVAASSIIQRTCSSIGLTEGVNCNTESNGLNIGSPLTGVSLGTLDPTWVSSNQPGIGGGLSTTPDLGYFNTTNPTSTSQTQYNGRLDADATHRDHLAFTIYWQPQTQTFYNGPTRSANLWHHSQVNDAVSLVWNHVFSSTLLNQARVNAAGWRWNEVDSNPQEPFGLPQDNVDAIGTIGNQGGFQYFGAPGPSNYDQWTYDYNDVLTKVAGKHNIKAGGDLTRLYYLNNPVYAARPTFAFRNLWDFANDAPYSESGQFDSATGVPFANRQDNRVNVWGFFVQDDYKIFPNLTLNFGLRYSYFGAFTSKDGNLDVLQFGQGSNLMSGLNIRVGGGLYTPQKGNFGPQLGFSWQPQQFTGRLVIRGGVGINYNQNEIAITANGNGNPPNAVQASFCCAAPGAPVAGILYETATSPNSIFGYAPNPATITQFGSNNLPLPGSSPIFATAFPSNPKTITNVHYSLDAEYALPYNLVATAGYMGNVTYNLLTQSNYNVVAAANGYALNPLINNLDYYSNDALANYNGLILTLKHEFSHQFSAEAQYTWSKALDEGSGPYEEDFYPYNLHNAYGRADYNVADAFKIFGLWQPVIFRGAHNWAEKVVGGWTLSGIFNLHSGFPLNPVYNANTSGGLYYNGSGYGQLRPSAIVSGYGKNTGNSTFMQATNPNYQGNGTQYFTAPQFQDGPAFPATSALPQPGIARNSLNGPGYNDVDASLSKAFGLPNIRVLGEGAKFEVRVDTFNLFNKLNINGASIDNNLGSVNPNGAVTSINSDFGVAGGALGSRTVQFQARFSF